jgi:hypothetical protein
MSPAAHWRLGVVLLVTLATFRGVTGLPFTIVDDPSFVVHNPFVIDPFGHGLLALLRTTSMGYPHTVTVLSLALDRVIFGAAPTGYHAVNLGVHLLNVVLLYALLIRLGVGVRIAAAAVALFALHPLVVEPVCWVIGRKDLLSTTLLLAAMLVFAGRRDDERRLGRGRWAVGDALCMAAMLAKPSALPAPALAWVLLRCVRPAEPRWRLVLGLAPQAMAAALIVLTGVSGLHTQGAVVDRTRAQIAFDIVRAWSLQLQHVVWPRGLLVEYERTSEGDPTLWVIVLASAATLAIAAYAWRRLRPRSVERMALAFVALAYVPVAGFLPTQHWTADSYFYLPLVGVTLAFATIVARGWEDLAGFQLVALALAVLSFVQIRTWSGAVAMFAPVAARYADDPRPLNRLAYAYAHENDRASAARAYIDLDESFPDFPFNRGERAWAYAFVGDLRGSDAVFARCIEAGDDECAARLFVEVVARRRSPRQVDRELLAAAYPVAAPALPRRLGAAGLRTVADWLRGAGLDELGRRADADAEMAATVAPPTPN